MKKIMFILLMSIVLIYFTACLKPASSPIEDFEYEFEDGEVTITKYIGEELKVVIPEKIKDRPVTVIGEDSFENYDLESVVLPDSIIAIDENAFRHCSKLKNVKLSENLEEIKWDAFEYCDSLEDIVIPDNVESVDHGAFSHCENLKNVSMSDELLESLRDKLFNESVYSMYKGVFAYSTDVVINGELEYY